MGNESKIVLKINNPEKENFRWVHLCYADKDIYSKYAEVNEILYMNESLSKWAKEDFNIDLTMDSVEDIYKLKELVKELYKEKYPEIYRDSNTDRQGWLRLWVNSKMKEELDSANR